MKKGDSHELTPEMDAATTAKFLAGARASGLRDDACVRCTRPFLTRHPQSQLCVPCRTGKPDGWTPAHTMRSVRFGQGMRRPDLSDCAACGGQGVVGWEPGGPTPPCAACKGMGQCEPPCD